MHFGWIYTHFLSENLFLNVIIHDTCMFGLHEQPYISYCIYTKDDSAKHNRFALTSEALAQFKKMLSFSETIQNLKFSVGDISINGVLQKDNDMPRLKYRLCESSDMNISHWDILLPHGIFTGKIWDGERELPLHAIVYQDHQYGSLPVQLFLDKWVWIVEATEDYTLCRFSLLFQNGESKTICWCFGTTQLSEEIKMEFDNDSFVAMRSKKNYIPLRERKHEKFGDFVLNYTRYLHNQNKSSFQVCEFMTIERSGHDGLEFND